jgi:hypothetical protein
MRRTRDWQGKKAEHDEAAGDNWNASDVHWAADVDPAAPQIMASEMSHSTSRVQSGDEVAQILIEQHRINRHVHKRIHPREPAILKRPEAPECTIDPAIITALFRQHAGELAYNERFRHGPYQRNQRQNEQAQPGSDWVDQRLGGVRAAWGGKEENKNEPERADRAWKFLQIHSVGEAS